MASLKRAMPRVCVTWSLPRTSLLLPVCCALQSIYTCRAEVPPRGLLIVPRHTR